MREKPHDYFNCGTTDKLILFSYLTDMDERIDREIDDLDNKEKFEANTDQTFADYFISEAEKQFEKKGYFSYHGTRSEIEDLREKIKDYDFWRAFMQTLQFAAFVFRSGSIRDIVQSGVVHKKVVDGAEQGGKKSGKVRREKKKSEKEAWQAEADKIWQKHPTLKNTEVARKIAKKFGGNPDTIRRSIKKPLL